MNHQHSLPGRFHLILEGARRCGRLYSFDSEHAATTTARMWVGSNSYPGESWLVWDMVERREVARFAGDAWYPGAATPRPLTAADCR